ncbi:MAG: N-6 DNA methylase, partial [Gemmatimonadota bacterium]
MTLEQLVAETRTLRQLPRLMQELGWEPAWEPLPAAFWRSRSAGPTSCWPSALIGRAGPLPWFGVEEKSGETLARSLARILQKRGTVAGIAVLDVESRKLSLCISFETLPVLTFPLTSPNSIQLACLRRLAETQSGGLLARAARVAEAIAGEGIGNRFFAAFETQLDRMADAIDGRFRPDERRSLALLQLNRVLFLYFVQSKGWLDARTDFLRTEIDRCLEGRRHLHRTLLQPLFFGTLNREISRRGKASGKLGRIPFLNGGLFEPHPLERRWQGTLSNAVWQDAFAQLFERFHFTVVEGSVSAVAPDMLGRVFEGVMAPAERRKSGTFYTPPDLVRSLIDESLLALIVERLGHTAVSAARLLHTRDESLHPLLDTLTLLDPAAGSGAFLLGALERLSHLRHSGRAGIWLTRRKVLLRSIYGVDVNPTAVRLSELRLWLAVIADDPTEDVTAVEPLPNLDCLVRQGDSLADPLALIARMPFGAGAMGSTLADLRRVVVASSGLGKKDAARALRHAECAAMKECLSAAEHALERRINEVTVMARTPDLFGQRQSAGACHTRIRELRAQWIPIRQARRRLEREGEVPWFQFEAHFADIFARRGGFDLVVGNPPWVRAEHLAP